MTGIRNNKPKDEFRDELCIKQAEQAIDDVLKRVNISALNQSVSDPKKEESKTFESALHLHTGKKRSSRNTSMNNTQNTKQSNGTSIQIGSYSNTNSGLKINSNVSLSAMEMTRESVEKQSSTTKWSQKFKSYKIPQRGKSRGASRNTTTNQLRSMSKLS